MSIQIQPRADAPVGYQLYECNASEIALTPRYVRFKINESWTELTFTGTVHQNLNKLKVDSAEPIELFCDMCYPCVFYVGYVLWAGLPGAFTAESLPSMPEERVKILTTAYEKLRGA